jgi:hypothetical protein
VSEVDAVPGFDWTNASGIRYGDDVGFGDDFGDDVGDDVGFGDGFSDGFGDGFSDGFGFHFGCAVGAQVVMTSGHFVGLAANMDGSYAAGR